MKAGPLRWRWFFLMLALTVISYVMIFAFAGGPWETRNQIAAGAFAVFGFLWLFGFIAIELDK